MTKYFQKSGNLSLIAKIYGLYTIKSSEYVDLDLILMQNVSAFGDKKNPSVNFDMKGSTSMRYNLL